MLRCSVAGFLLSYWLVNKATASIYLQHKIYTQDYYIPSYLTKILNKKPENVILLKPIFLIKNATICTCYGIMDPYNIPKNIIK